MFSHLSKMGRLTHEILKDMPVVIDIKSRYFYKQGAIEKEFEKDYSFVKSLLIESNFDLKKMPYL